MAEVKTPALSSGETEALLRILESRFTRHMDRHPLLNWPMVRDKLLSYPEKIWSLYEMERTGGEPDVVILDVGCDDWVFCDCSVESPSGRRSLCYDPEALAARKENKPENSAVGMASDMGIELLSEAGYHQLQKFGTFDTKTSSWLKTPPEIRALGGAIFGDFRYGRVFVYHNGASSYYNSRGFRGILRL